MSIFASSGHFEKILTYLTGKLSSNYSAIQAMRSCKSFNKNEKGYYEVSIGDAWDYFSSHFTKEMKGISGYDVLLNNAENYIEDYLNSEFTIGKAEGVDGVDNPCPICGKLNNNCDC